MWFMFDFSTDYGRQSRIRKNNFHHDLPSVSECRNNPMSFVRDAPRVRWPQTSERICTARVKYFPAPIIQTKYSSPHYTIFFFFFWKKVIRDIHGLSSVLHAYAFATSNNVPTQTASDRNRNLRSVESEIFTLNINAIHPKRVLKHILVGTVWTHVR